MSRSDPRDPALFAQIHELVTARPGGSERGSEEASAALAKLLGQSAPARRVYLEYIADSVSLHFRAQAGAAPAPVEARSVLRKWWPLRNARLAWAAACGLAVALGTALWAGHEPAPTYRGVAVLARAVDVSWQPAGALHAPGSLLPAGPLRLVRGAAQIEFFGGATLVVEAPADLDLVSASEVFVRRGKVRASVPPPARGFLVGAPGVGVVDLGTELGVDVQSTGAEVRVFDGEVELRSPAGSAARPPARLAKDESVLVRRSGERLPASDAHGAYLDRAGLARLADGDVRRREETWRTHTRALDRDPAVVLHYAFEGQEPWDRAAVNQAGRTSGAHGAIVGARWTAGRWPAKKALDFKRPGDRVRVLLPGRFDSMTFAAWVRFDGFDRRWISLFLTDDWDPGEPHWQVSREGEMILGVSGPGNHFSPRVLSAHDLGRWVHLATVYDGRSRSVTHYLDGRPVAAVPIRGYLPLVVGAAEIGNWGVPLGHVDTKIRNFNGALDEIAILGRAVSAAEMAAMYEAGRPQ